eukprot:16221455-Heterocapsa_arctica.AAC.1
MKGIGGWGVVIPMAGGLRDSHLSAWGSMWPVSMPGASGLLGPRGGGSAGGVPSAGKREVRGKEGVSVEGAEVVDEGEHVNGA